VVDISNPQSPQEVGIFQKPGESFVDLAVTGNFGYITTEERGFYIVDLSNPASPFEVSFFELSGASKVVIQEHYAYIWKQYYGLQARAKLYILNVSNPKNPIGVASYDGLAGDIWDVAVNGDDIFLANFMGGTYALYFPSTLSINYPNGMQGSYFTLQGKNFDPNTPVTVLVNGHEIGMVLSDSLGNVEFVLSTENADNGKYVVSAVANVKWSVSFRLGADYPLRPLEGSGTILIIPGGIAIDNFQYLPVINN